MTYSRYQCSLKAHGTTATPPQENLKWGCDPKTADNICCFNRHYAEHSGYVGGAQRNTWYIYWTTYVYLLVQYLHTPATNDPICTRLCNHAGFLTRYFATTEFLKKESEASGEITFYDTVTGKPVENPLSNQESARGH